MIEFSPIYAITKEEFLAAKERIEGGESIRSIKRNMGINRKTLSKALRLYEVYGDKIFQPQKVPLRSKKYREGKRELRVRKINARIANILISSKWDKITPCIMDKDELADYDAGDYELR